MSTLHRQALRWIIILIASLIAIGISWRLYTTAQGKIEFIFHPWFMAPALALALLQKALGPILIMIVFKSINIKTRYMPLLWISMFSSAAASTVPFPAGIPIRAVLQKRILGISYNASASGLVIEMFLSYGFTVLICIITGYLWLTPVLKIPAAFFKGTSLTVFAVIGLLLTVCLAFAFTRRLHGHLMMNLKDALNRILNAGYGSLVFYLALIIFLHFIAILRLEMVLHAMGFYVPPGPLLSAMVFSYLAGVASFIPMGLGVRDVSLCSLLVLLGVPPAPAAAAAAIDRILISLPFLIGGTIAGHTLGRDLTGLKEEIDEKKKDKPYFC